MNTKLGDQASIEADRDRLATHSSSVAAVVRALEQQVVELDEARYDALREAGDASRRAAELGLQAIEARIRLCAFMEHEPIRARQGVSDREHVAVLRLAHAYFDEPDKYRLALYAYHSDRSDTPGVMDEPAWYSRIVYDTSHPGSKCAVSSPDTVRAAYQAAEQRGYRLAWPTTDQWLSSIRGPGPLATQPPHA